MTVGPAYRYECNLHRVIDGDTVDLDIDLGFHITNRIRVRLLGVDAPEIRGPEKVAGDIVTDRVRYWLQANGKLTVETVKTGKYGRWLGTIHAANADCTLNEAVARWTSELVQ